MKKTPFLYGFLIVLLLTSSFLIFHIMPMDFVEAAITDTLLADYYIGNRSTWQTMKSNHPSSGSAYSATGQSFQTPNDGVSYTLTSVNFTLYKIGSPTGNGYAKLYAHSGTFGTSSVPTGSPLATSDAVDVSLLPTAGTYDTIINFTDNYAMTANSYYFIDWENPSSGIDTSNYVSIGVDSTSPTGNGNCALFRNSAWSAVTGADVAGFAVYGTPSEGGTSFTEQGNISVSFGVTSTKTMEMATYRSIVSTFAWNAVPSWTFITYRTIPISFAFTSTFSYSLLGLTLENIYSSITFAFGLTNTKQITFTSFHTIPFSFTIGTSQSILSNIMNIFGSITATFGFEGKGPLAPNLWLEFFTEFMFGSGSWFALIIAILLLMVISILNKYGGILSWAIAFFMFFMYINHEMFWEAILMFIAGLFMLLFSVHEVRKK